MQCFFMSFLVFFVLLLFQPCYNCRQKHCHHATTGNGISILIFLYTDAQIDPYIPQYIPKLYSSTVLYFSCPFKGFYTISLSYYDFNSSAIYYSNSIIMFHFQYNLVFVDFEYSHISWSTRFSCGDLLILEFRWILWLIHFALS